MTIASDQWQTFKHMGPWQCGKFRDMFIPCMGHAAAVADAAAAAEAAAACFLGSSGFIFFVVLSCSRARARALSCSRARVRPRARALVLSCSCDPVLSCSRALVRSCNCAPVRLCRSISDLYHIPLRLVYQIPSISLRLLSDHERYRYLRWS